MLFINICKKSSKIRRVLETLQTLNLRELKTKRVAFQNLSISIAEILSYLSSKVTAPATTGDATLVPDSDRQPPLEIQMKKLEAFLE